MPVRVAVIGAGAGGLAALRHLTAKPQTFQPVAYEQSTVVGGTWVYNEQTGTDDYGLPIHSSMYKNLKTNLPKEVMAFPDFPFPKDLPSFVKHTDVYEYLENYAEHFHLKQHIKFSTTVEMVEPLTQEDGLVKWKVKSKSLLDKGKTETEMFEAVMVCNGHYSVPLFPEIPGMDKFKGLQMHSHEYRMPEAFKDMNVVVLGAGSSGLDIAMELSGTAKEVTLSHNRDRLKSPLPGNVTESLGIKLIKENSVEFLDGKEKPVDAILYCTGYHYSYPFLSEKCGLGTHDERVTPLYKHLIHTRLPSLCIIGVCKIICPFPQFDVQAQFFLKTLEGAIKLPSQEEMERETERDFQQRLSSGFPARYAHKMGTLQWGYNDELGKMAGLKPISTKVQKLYNEVHDIRAIDLQNYKKRNIVEDGGENVYRII